MDLLSLGKDPINPDQPAGSDVRYEPEFEKLQAETDKLSSPSSSGGIDWEKVSDMAALIMAEKSKDLLVASYLAVSQVYTHQIEGLAVGVTVMHDLMENFWDTLFPPKKRMRGRLGAIEWWIEKTGSAFKHIKTESIADEKLNELNETLARIETLLKEYFPKPHLRNPIQRYVQSIPCLSEQKPDTRPPPAVEEKAVPETPSAEERSQAVAPFETKPEPEKKAPKPVASSPRPERLLQNRMLKKQLAGGSRSYTRPLLFY